MPQRAMSARYSSFVFEMTQCCNHDCLYCYNVWKNRTPYPMGRIGTDETLAMLDAMIGQTHARLVSLSGGEPLLREDFLDVVDFLHERGVAVNLITNGSLLSGEIIGGLAGKISVFELPLLSADRAVHDRMSGASGAFDGATLAMAELKAARERVVGVFVATRLNLPTWPETAELAVALGLDGVMFNRFNPGGRGFENLGLLQAAPDEIARALDIAEQTSARYDLPIGCSIAMPPCLFDTGRFERLSFGFCAAGTERAYYTLDPVGNVRPCNHSATILGNIRETGFRACADSPAMRRFTEARPEFCAGCRFEMQCLGGCKAAAEACFGTPTVMDPFLAAFHHLAAKPG